MGAAQKTLFRRDPPRLIWRFFLIEGIEQELVSLPIRTLGSRSAMQRQASRVSGRLERINDAMARCLHL